MCSNNNGTLQSSIGGFMKMIPFNSTNDDDDDDKNNNNINNNELIKCIL